MSACAALSAALEAHTLYGEGHPIPEEAARAAATALADACAAGPVKPIAVTPTELHVQAGADTARVPASRLARALHGADVAAISVGAGASADDVRAFVASVASGALHDASASGTREPAAFGAISLTVLKYGTLRAGASQSEQRITWDTLARLSRGERAGGAGAASEEVAELLRDLTQPGAGAPGELASALRGARDETERDAVVTWIRGALSSLSPEMQADFAKMSEGGSGLNIDDMTELADVLPIARSCRALQALDASRRTASAASVRMFKRLARVGTEQNEHLARVSSLASAWTDGAGGEERHKQALRAIAELCGETARCDFIPEDYERRLDEIANESADEHAPVAVRETAREDLVQGVRIALMLASDPSEEDEGVAQRLVSLIDPVVEAGEIGALGDIAGFAYRSGGTEAGDELARRVSDPELLARAVSSCRDAEEFRRSGGTVRALVSDDPGRFVIGVLTGPANPVAHAFAHELMRTLTPTQQARMIGDVTRTSPGSLGAVREVLASLGAGEALESVRSALEHASGADRRAVYEAAAALEHEWPHSLIVRGLVEEDEACRAVARAYVVERAPAHASVLRARVLGSLGGPETTAGERASIVDALARIDRRTGTRHAERALLAASVRPTATGAKCGSAVWRYAQRHPGAVRTPTRAIWAVSPVRALAALGDFLERRRAR